MANTNQSATGAEPENGTATAIDGALGEWGGGPGLERGSSRKLPQMGGAGGPGLAPGGSHGGGRGGEKSGTIGPSVGEGTASLLVAPVKRAPTLTPLALGHEVTALTITNLFCISVVNWNITHELPLATRWQR